MKRREFIGLIGSAAAWPFAARAQQTGMRRVGLLMGGRGETDPEGQARLAVVRRGLRDRGWEEGRNLQLDLRWAAGNPEQIRAAAAQLVELAPEVIIANGTPVTDALFKTTRTIPIVMALVVDPVGLGYVGSIARPGGNITGFTFVDLDLLAKWGQILKEAVPSLVRAAVLYHPDNTPFYLDFLGSLEKTRNADAVALFAATVRSVADIESAVAGVPPGGGIIIPPNSFVASNRKLVADLTRRYKLPSISVYREYMTDGGLISYGPDTNDIFLRSTDYVDRILRGANPAELPVQAPTKYEFVINLKTAKALGIDVPPTLLARADEVIE
jgi:putative ABC transport system substrate-binding protein